MAICSRCGKPVSGFTFGSPSDGLCKDCRTANALQLKSDAARAGTLNPAAPVVAPLVPYVTCTLIAINVLVYLAMGVFGASWTAPSIADAVRWGADFGPLSLSGEWWRLFTCVFVHFGFFHICFNMWCLGALGPAVERLMGRWAFLLMYVCSGLVASLASDLWAPWRVSAGASGAIFGVAGAFVSYLLLKKTSMDPAVVKRNLRNMAIFIGYNLLRGAASFSIDNAAHIGGLAAGLALGAILPPLIMPSTTAGLDSSAVSPQAVPGMGAPSASEQNSNRFLLAVAIGSALLIAIAAQRVHAFRLSAALYGEGVKAVRVGDLNSGVADMQRSADLDPQSLLSLALLGELRLEQSDPGDAVAPIEKALVIAPDAYDLEHNLALAYLGVGRWGDAMRATNGVIDKEGNDPWRARFIFGVARGELGSSVLASTTLNQVVESQPDMVEAKDALAFFEVRSGKADLAAAQYREVLESHPDDSDAIAGLKLLSSSTKPIEAQWPQVPSIPFSKLEIKSDYWPLFP